MKTALDLIFIISWITAYLTVVYVVAHYRRARATVLGLVEGHEYRAEKDAVLWLVVFLAGTLLGAIAYFGANALGQAL